MKKSILLVIFFMLSIPLFAQQWKDVLYLKNGSIIKGTIIEQIPDASYKIQMESGNVFVYSADEVLKIAKELTQDKNSSLRENTNSYLYDTSTLRVSGKQVINEYGTVFSKQQMENLLGYEEANQLYHYINLASWSIPTAGASLSICAIPLVIGICLNNNGWLLCGICMTAACCTLFGVGISASFKADKILDEYRTRNFSIQVIPTAIPLYAIVKEPYAPGLQINITF